MKISPRATLAAASVLALSSLSCSQSKTGTNPSDLLSNYNAFVSVNGRGSSIVTQFEEREKGDDARAHGRRFGAAAQALLNEAKANGFQTVADSVVELAKSLGKGNEAETSLVLAFAITQSALKTVGKNTSENEFMLKFTVLPSIGSANDISDGNRRKASEILFGNPSNGNNHGSYGFAWTWDAIVKDGKTLKEAATDDHGMSPPRAESDPNGKIFKNAKDVMIKLATGQKITMLLNNQPSGVAALGTARTPVPV